MNAPPPCGLLAGSGYSDNLVGAEINDHERAAGWLRDNDLCHLGTDEVDRHERARGFVQWQGCQSGG